MKERRIPSTIAHPFPDNVSRPFWAFRDKKSLADEFFDCYVSFKELKCHEYFWEWQSRPLDETLVKKLVKSYKFFKDHPIGDKRFVTFIVNNNNVKDLGKLYMSIILSNEFAKQKKFPSPPLFEVVHPGKSTNSLMHFIKLYSESVSIACDKFKKDVGPKNISIIPTHDFSISSGKWFKTMHDFIREYEQNFRTKIESIRPLIPRNLLADKLGFVASVLATKRTLSNYHSFAQITGIEVMPIVQTSVLPFRGGLSPDNIKEFALTYPGIRSATISASFRYDFPVDKVIPAVGALNRGLHHVPKKIFTQKEGQTIKKVEDIFANNYKKSMESFPDMKITRDSLPPQLKDSFTLYSLGIPPELIGVGTSLLELINTKMMKDLEDIYNIKADIRKASQLLNKENLNLLSKTAKFWKDLKKDIALVEDYVGDLGPQTTDDFLHRNHTSNVFHNMMAGRDITKDLEAAAKARHSLG
ncbi:phosphoenolpyruvate carboxylase [Nanoarchaeota archaeon]